MQVNILEAKNRLSQLVKCALAGEEVVIANRGEPVARIVPVRPGAAESGEPGSGAAFARWLRHHPLPAHLQRGHEEIEAGIRAERAGWD
ncbi:MAG: type II toxin-antitoxin system prevent-host-death family antitoxin [Burkholderiales bacterium]|nr:MAG: type II toxin-antitoxin system prevent-host-death family antitoxin [Burkholderiales bacterium]